MFNHGVRGRRGGDSSGMVTLSTGFVETKNPQVIINGYSVSAQPDKALDTAGGQTVLVTGGGFTSGITGTLGGVAISPITYISPTQVSFTSPAKSGGLYVLVLTNTNGGTGALVPGITYSSVPTFTTSAGSIGTVYETTQYSKSVVATSDSTITYALTSGSLPPDASLNTSTGAVTGNVPVINSGSSTYSFSITATDSESQSVTRSFTITESIDILTWVTPTSGASIGVDNNPYSLTLSATDAAGYTPNYTVDTLPTGLSLTNNIISGTPTVDNQTVTSTLTAASSTTTRYSNISVSWTVSFADTFWFNTTLLLSANSIIQTNSFMNDNSLNNQQLTPAGTVRAQNFNPYQFGYYGVSFDGSSGYLSLLNSPVTNFSSGSYTVETWIYLTALPATSATMPIAQMNAHQSGSTFWEFNVFNNAGTYQLICNSYNGSSYNYQVTLNVSITTGVWYHVAAFYNGTNAYVAFNGTVSTGIAYAGSALPAGATFYIGYQFGTGSGTVYFNGYMSNYRITKGSALYSSPSFTIPTGPLSASASSNVIMVCQSPNLLDTSPNLNSPTSTGTVKIASANPFTTPSSITVNTGYSTYFNGTTDYLSIPSSSALDFVTGDMTFECWFYLTADTPQDGDGLRNATIIAAFPASGSLLTTYGGGITGDANSTGTGISFSARQGGVNQSASYTGTITKNAWHHFAFTRTGSTANLYLDGTRVAQNTSFTNVLNTNGQTFKIGGLVYSTNYNQYFPGYISNFRLLKGTALYTGASFTPPTSPLTAITNTTLLTCQGSVIADASTNSLSLTAAGSPKVVNNVYPFTQTTTSVTSISTLGSGYFDSSTGYLSLPYSGNLALSNNNFTIEAWVYLTSSSSTQVLASMNSTGATANTAYQINLNGGGSITASAYNSTTAYSATSASAISINAWHHVAFVRNGTNIIVYLDGIGGTPTAIATTALNNNTSMVTLIGAIYTTGTTVGSFLGGYINNFRIVNGTALYTGNFAPSPNTLAAVTNTQLLTLQSNGAHNSDTFNDNSSFNSVNQITRNGNANNGTFGPYGDNFSYYFGGNGNYMYPPSNSAFNVGATGSNFTVECWIYMISSTIFICVGNGSAYGNGVIISFNGTAFAFSQSPGSAGGFGITTPSSYSLNTWYHIALVRNSNVYTLYVNGTNAATGTNGSGAVSASTLVINGANDNNGVGNSGGAFYMSNLRWVSGVAVYTSTFTPPTTPLTALQNANVNGNPSAAISNGTVLLTCQSNRFVDNSTTNGTISTGGTPNVQKFSPFGSVTISKYYSTYLSATGDYLTIPYNTTNFDWYTSSTDYTIEAWFMITAAGWQSNTPSMIGNMTPAAGTNYWSLGINASLQPNFYYFNGAGNNVVISSITCAYNTWYHIAMCKTNSGIQVFCNGVGGTVTAISGTPQSSSGTTLTIGQFNSVTCPGYISNVRIVKGTAVYSGTTYTVPTTPLTAITNTKLLTCQNNTFIDNSINALTITTGSNAIKPLAVSPFISTASLKLTYTPATYSGSINFNGTSGYLVLPNNPILAMGTSNFTIEFWAYNTSIPTTWTYIDTRPNGVNGSYITLAYNNTPNNIFLYVNSALISTNVTPPVYAWYHLALCRSSGTSRIFLNGVQIGSATDSTAYGVGGNGLVIGGNSIGLNSSWFPGYLSDIRIINGVGLYSSNFVPTTSPLTATTSTVLLLNGTSNAITDATRSSNLESLGTARSVNFSPYNGNYYSNYFASSSFQLAYTSTPIVAQGTAYTIEAWVYITAVGTANTYAGAQPIACTASSSASTGNGHHWAFGPTAFVWENRAGNAYPTISYTAPLNQWFHFAFTTSDGQNFTLYINGSSVGTYNDTSGTYYADSTYNFYVGAGNGTGSNANTGTYISNLRYTKAQVYTGNFTVSTTPLTAIQSAGTNISAITAGQCTVLTCQSNKFLDNSSLNSVISTISGTPKVQTQNPFQVNTGLGYYINGSTDYIYVSATVASPSYTFGTGDFTIELWAYFNDVTTEHEIIDFRPGSTQGLYPMIYVSSSNLYYWVNNANQITGSSAVTVGQWYHIVVSRSGTSTKMFVNGTQVGSTYTDSNSYLVGVNRPVLGLNGFNSLYFLNGYLADVRITKGVARYTTTFIPPVGPRPLK